eukprot:7389948-Prymnesium_polylepis.1
MPNLAAWLRAHDTPATRGTALIACLMKAPQVAAGQNPGSLISGTLRQWPQPLRPLTSNTTTKPERTSRTGNAQFCAHLTSTQTSCCTLFSTAPWTLTTGLSKLIVTLRSSEPTKYADDAPGKAALKKALDKELKQLNQSAFYIITDTIEHKTTLQHIERAYD